MSRTRRASRCSPAPPIPDLTREPPAALGAGSRSSYGPAPMGLHGRDSTGADSPQSLDVGMSPAAGLLRTDAKAS